MRAPSRTSSRRLRLAACGRRRAAGLLGYRAFAMMLGLWAPAGSSLDPRGAISIVHESRRRQ
ncbi:hypothetical protein I550_2084 [Mycobacterium intracellulare 1956]|uniref:Uncharacterized protein n=1 Tax=Mycobacterium intracellulare 1956 TaxID=1299331 RepID=X8CSA7_MYCIT|nr:hypothetical protein I548_5054 [Mycobacterium intracellulare]EUA58939.1 hypothetical protein I550_2084 [Mycobacterium intracellulare 1956]